MAELTYSTQAPGSVPADVLVVPVFEGPEAGPGVRDVKGVDLLGVYAAAKLKGKKGENLLVPNLGNERLAAKAVLLLGLGKRNKATADTLRRAIGKAAPQLARHESVATTLPQAAGRSPEGAVEATVEGLLLGPYRFDRYKSGKKEEGAPEKPALKTVTVLGPARWDRRKIRGALARAEIVADAVAWTRDLVNTPAIDCSPDFLAREAQAMAKEVGLEVKIWSDAELEKGGFGGILGVGRGSERPCRLIELKYRGAGNAAPIAITGKGITFDSGGLDIKDAKGMESMKDDMAGAAAMLGVMKAVARLKPKVNVIAAIPSAENMPSGSAIRPGDVLRHRGGKTSEVLNTDAEGRLVLADALAYLSESKPRVIVDAATLTGACMVALGNELYGVIGNDRALIRDLLAAGEAAGEPGWELPLWEGYKPQIESSVADVQNIGERWGGAITAGLFLSEFVDGTPWAHLDIAGTAFADKPGDYWPKGATGSPVRAVVRYILGQAAKPRRR